MKSLQDCAVDSLDGTDSGLFPYLPHILQDIWEIGTSPSTIIDLIRKHTRDCSRLRVLDLGCGKGAASVRLTHALGCRCLGIDAIDAFIDEARRRAREYGVDSLCVFETGDIRKRVRQLTPYDIVILGAIGPVFGDYSATLSTVSPCLTSHGLIIIDDGYSKDGSSRDCGMPTKQEMLKHIEGAGMRLIDEDISDRESIERSNADIFEKMQLRCEELARKYPDKRALFERYIQKQKEENDLMEDSLVCSTMVIAKM